jgi:hypothetical protein
VLLHLEKLGVLDERKPVHLRCIKGRVEFFSHKELHQESGSANVHPLYAYLIIPVKRKVLAGVLYHGGIVSFSLGAYVLLVVNDFLRLHLLINDDDTKPYDALFLAHSENAELGLERLPRHTGTLSGDS